MLPDRRDFLRSSTQLGMGLVATATGLQRASSAVPIDASAMRMPSSGLVPTEDTHQLMRLIDQTSRERCPELIVEKLKAGVPYRELLAAAFLFAALRDGHHTVYLVQSAHQLTLDAAPEDRMLPLIWAVDNMKEALARARAEQVAPLAGRFPSAERAAIEFETAMEAMDREKAEHAIVALARAEGPQQAYQRFMKYAARDNYFIGHIPIGIVSAGRALDVIGWHHAEPTLRYIVRDMYRHEHDLEGQPYPHNVERANQMHDQLPIDWAGPGRDTDRTKELYEIMLGARWWISNEWIAEHLVAGEIQAGTVWDAVHLFAANLMILHKLGGRRIGNRALHANTTANALHYVFARERDSYTRLLTLFQAVSWATENLVNEQRLDHLRDLDITALDEVELDDDDGTVVDEIYSSLPPRIVYTENLDRTGQDRAAGLAFSLAKRSPDHQAFLRGSRAILCRYMTINAHDLKYPIAMFEELQRIHPVWRPHLLAATVHFMPSSQGEQHPAVNAGLEAMNG